MDTEPDQERSAAFFAWGLTYALAALTFWIALGVDVFTRYGEPLMVVLQPATFVWVVALALMKIAENRAIKLMD